jgi:adenosylcobinamide kinase / adenosylcobinamide-phosphate guanylyltransferase
LAWWFWPAIYDRRLTRMADAGAGSSRLTLVTGGARSGKSRYAESLITALPPPWVYVATAESGDTEMAARIAAHRAGRSTQWKIIEAPHALARVFSQISADAPVLVDCLTLWLSNRCLAGADIDAEVGQFANALARHAGPVVLVTNEVGSGIVPDNALARRFRDEQGRLNQRIAALADRVVLVVAGLPLILKGSA